jgi:UDP-N-acetylmuramoylalanine-D-glutamate ligase
MKADVAKPPSAEVLEAGRETCMALQYRTRTITVMHIHILGICGTFMGGLAALAREAGHKVTGCDANVYPPMSDQLRALGIELIDGYGTDQVALAPDLYVIGNAVSRGNPLMEAILDDGLRYVSGPQWLAEHVLEGRHVLAVAGTHGKTTTTAMLAWILDQAGLEPGFLVGGVPRNFGVSARLGKTAGAGGARSPFVIEADEYDTAFFDKRSKFVHYHPRTAVLNNLEYDHADIFPDLAAIETQFHHLVRTMPSRGRIVVNSREESLQRVLERGCWSEVQRFGARKEEPGALRARGEPHAFDVLRGSMKIARVEWHLLGEHNQMNALAAIAAAEHLGHGRRRAGQLRERRAPARAQGREQRHPGVRRLRAPSDRDSNDHRRPAPQGRRAAHPGRVRAALQHHEARRDEGATAMGARRGRPVVLPLRWPHVGRRRGARSDGQAGRRVRHDRRDGVRRRAHRQARRPHPVHEQRRLRRHPRQAADRARGAAHLRLRLA